MKISNHEKAYYEARDRCRGGEIRHDFEQILGEHAKSLVDLALAHAGDSKAEIMRHVEKLTELHIGWESRVAKPGDEGRWTRAVRVGVRKSPYSIMKLMTALFPGKSELVYSGKQVYDMLHDVSVGVNIGADIHVGWCGLTGQHADALRDAWKHYGRMCVKTIGCLRHQGRSSGAFFRAAAGTMEAGLRLGSLLDEFTINKGD